MKTVTKHGSIYIESMIEKTDSNGQVYFDKHLMWIDDVRPQKPIKPRSTDKQYLGDIFREMARKEGIELL